MRLGVLVAFSLHAFCFLPPPSHGCLPLLGAGCALVRSNSPGGLIRSLWEHKFGYLDISAGAYSRPDTLIGR